MMKWGQRQKIKREKKAANKRKRMGFQNQLYLNGTLIGYCTTPVITLENGEVIYGTDNTGT